MTSPSDKEAESQMRLATLAVNNAVVIMGLNNLPLYAQAPGALDAGLRIEPEQAKAGDTVRMSVTLHNKSAKETSLGLMIPYIAYPEIENARTGTNASFWAPPTNGVVRTNTVLIKPGLEDSLLAYAVKMTDEKLDGRGAAALSNLLRPANWTPSSGLPANTALMNAEPGTYSVKFKLSLGAKLIESVSKTFQVKRK